MIEQPDVIETEACAAAVIRLTIPRQQMRDVMMPAIGELVDAIAEQGLTPVGPLFAHHLRMEPGIFDLEVGFPVSGMIADRGRVKPGGLPAARVARTLYHGPYDGLPAAWGEFDAWVRANGHAVSGDLWESYIEGPESSPDPAGWRTELNRPLK